MVAVRFLLLWFFPHSLPFLNIFHSQLIYQLCLEEQFFFFPPSASSTNSSAYFRARIYCPVLKFPNPPGVPLVSRINTGSKSLSQFWSQVSTLISVNIRPRVLLPHTHPTSHLFSFVIRWECMRINWGTVSFGMSVLLYILALFCFGPGLWFLLTPYKVASLYHSPLDAVLHFCRE